MPEPREREGWGWGSERGQMRVAGKVSEGARHSSSPQRGGGQGKDAEDS